MNWGRAFGFVAGMLIILIQIAFNWWVFQFLFNITYLDWYLKNGSLIGVASAFLALVWVNLNKLTGLISTHPLDYIDACRQLAGLPMIVIGTHLGKNRGERASISLFDMILSVPIVLIVMIGVIIWFIVIVPVQYFVYLISGAPARLMVRSDRRVVAQLELGKVRWMEINTSDDVPKGWWDASLSDDPVVITNLIAALLLFGLRMALN